MAEDEGRIVANIGVSGLGPKQRLRHRATFGISVDQAYHGQGLGRHMMQTAIAFCKEAGLEQLELEVVGDNVPAISMYTSFGFEQVGEIPRGFKYPDGSYASLVMMVLDLREEP